MRAEEILVIDDTVTLLEDGVIDEQYRALHEYGTDGLISHTDRHGLMTSITTAIKPSYGSHVAEYIDGRSTVERRGRRH